MLNLKAFIVGFSLSTASLAAAANSKAPYMIPAGKFLTEDLVLQASKVKLSKFSDGTYSLRYRLPAEMDGSDGRTVDLTSVSAAEPLKLKGSFASAKCADLGSTIACEISYQKTQNDPNSNVETFALNVPAADAYIDTLALSTEQVANLKQGQLALMHEAIGVITVRKK